jgi:hypothetical protein
MQIPPDAKTSQVRILMRFLMLVLWIFLWRTALFSRGLHPASDMVSVNRPVCIAGLWVV